MRLPSPATRFGVANASAKGSGGTRAGSWAKPSGRPGTTSWLGPRPALATARRPLGLGKPGEECRLDRWPPPLNPAAPLLTSDEGAFAFRHRITGILAARPIEGRHPVCLLRVDGTRLAVRNPRGNRQARRRSAPHQGIGNVHDRVPDGVPCGPTQFRRRIGTRYSSPGDGPRGQQIATTSLDPTERVAKQCGCQRIHTGPHPLSA